MRGLIQFFIVIFIFRAGGIRIRGWRRREGSPSFGLGLGDVGLVLLCRARWACILQMPRLVAMAAPKSCILVIQCLGPDKVIYLEIDLFWKTFTQVLLHTYSCIGVETFGFPPKISVDEAAQGVSYSSEDPSTP